MPPNQSTTLHPKASEDIWSHPELITTLKKAAKTFVKEEQSHVELWAAATDWFLEEWGRDTFIALPGLLVATKRFEETRSVFRHFAEHQKDGLIPNRIQADGTILYNTVDAPLWFIMALKTYVEASQDKTFLEEMKPIVERILFAYKNGTNYERSEQIHHIGMDPEDGLIASPAQATWMDADPSGTGQAIVTPRNGKCVEINVLWYASLKWFEELTNETLPLSKQVKRSFNKKFWNAPEKCLLDVIEGDPHAGALRPNQIIAVSHGGDLLSKTRHQQVLRAINKDLLTPGGLRTLSPRDSHYRGHYDTSAPMAEKDLAYHQGTVWPWLIGPYCDAMVIVERAKGSPEAKITTKMRKILTPLVTFCLESELQSLPEVFSGDPPYEPGGTRSQAWSIAEVLRVIIEYKLLTSE